MAENYRDADSIVSAQWLHAHIDDANLRVFDCTMYLVADTDDSPYRVISGREDYLLGHIPGAGHIDLQNDLSDPDSPFRFTLPQADDLLDKLSALGIEDQSRVVLYSRGSLQWATRVWWMLRSAGFDSAAVLDGGWQQWRDQDRPVATGGHRYEAARLATHSRSGLFCDRHAVQRAVDDSDTVVINALSAQLHQGLSARYGRAGRIPGSVNVAASALQDTETGKLLDAKPAAALFKAVGVEPDSRVVIYCGGGIAATLDAFVLHQLGCDDITVYDNSLNEWAQDLHLPMQTG